MFRKMSVSTMIQYVLQWRDLIDSEQYLEVMNSYGSRHFVNDVSANHITESKSYELNWKVQDIVINANPNMSFSNLSVCKSLRNISLSNLSVCKSFCE